MRIALVVNQFPKLSETFIFNKAIELRRSGIDVSILAHDPLNDTAHFFGQLNGEKPIRPAYALTAHGSIQLPVRIAYAFSKAPIASVRVWQSARRLYGRGRRATRAYLLALPLVAGKFDLIHFEFSGIAVNYQDTFQLLRPARLVTSCRGSAEQITPLAQPKRAFQLAEVFAQIDAVHCVSTDILHTVKGYGLDAKKAFVIHPAINIAQFRRASHYHIREHGQYRVVSVGRAHWKKGHIYGLEAVRLLLEQGRDLIYELIGTDPADEQLQFAIHDFGLDGHARLLGQMAAKKVQETLEGADIFWLPSLSEGLSNAALEAMAMELPVVSTRAGGMEEAITDGVEGFLVQRRDPLGLAEATNKLLDDPRLRLRMGQAGRRRVEQDFNLEAQVQAFSEHYRRLLISRNDLDS